MLDQHGVLCLAPIETPVLWAHDSEWPGLAVGYRAPFAGAAAGGPRWIRTSNFHAVKDSRAGHLLAA